jgi:hypothetical protein
MISESPERSDGTEPTVELSPETESGSDPTTRLDLPSRTREDPRPRTSGKGPRGREVTGDVRIRSAPQKDVTPPEARRTNVIRCGTLDRPDDTTG